MSKRLEDLSRKLEAVFTIQDEAISLEAKYDGLQTGRELGGPFETIRKVLEDIAKDLAIHIARENRNG